MNTSVKTGALVFLASLALPCMAQRDQSASCASKSGTSLERKVDHEAAKGPTALRRFVSRTQTVYQLDYATEASRYSVAQERERACEARRAAAPRMAER